MGRAKKETNDSSKTIGKIKKKTKEIFVLSLYFKNNLLIINLKIFFYLRNNLMPKKDKYKVQGGRVFR